MSKYDSSTNTMFIQRKKNNKNMNEMLIINGHDMSSSTIQL